MYSIFDILIELDMALPELKTIDIGEPHIRITRGISLDTSTVTWYYKWMENNLVYIRFGRLEEKTIIEFPGMAYFAVDLNKRTIEYYPSPKIPSESIRHLLIDQVIPRMLGQLGKVILHASAIVLPSGMGVAFVGESGWGKSTIASSFLESGGRILSDDCLLLEPRGNKVIATASYQGIRLLDDSARAVLKNKLPVAPVSHYSNKRRGIVDQSKSVNSVSLDAVMLLSNPAEMDSVSAISVERTYGTESLMGLMRQLFVLNPLERKIITNLFSSIGKTLSSGLPVYRLRYPHRHDLLPEVQRTIVGQVS